MKIRWELIIKMKTTMKWISNITTMLLFVLLLVMVFFVISMKASGGEPNVFGYQLKTVLSGSMDPTFKTGSIIAVEPVKDKTELKKDDIITYVQQDGQLVTHRITEVLGSGEQLQYVTKGDSNKEADVTPVLAENVVAKYSSFTIPYVGYFVEFAKSQKGTVVLLIVPGILLLIYAGFQIWSGLKVLDVSSRKQPSNTENS